MSTTLGPKQVLIIRHGEKVGDPKKDNDGGRNLSIRGSARAAALPALFVPAMPQSACRFYQKNGEFVGSYQEIPLKGAASRFATPAFIFATAKSKNSKRPIETVTPLSIALAEPINDRFSDNDADIKQMTGAILHVAAFIGKVVLICWHMEEFPMSRRPWELRSRQSGTARSLIASGRLRFRKERRRSLTYPRSYCLGTRKDDPRLNDPESVTRFNSHGKDFQHK